MPSVVFAFQPLLHIVDLDCVDGKGEIVRRKEENKFLVLKEKGGELD